MSEKNILSSNDITMNNKLSKKEQKTLSKLLNKAGLSSIDDIIKKADQEVQEYKLKHKELDEKAKKITEKHKSQIIKRTTKEMSKIDNYVGSQKIINPESKKSINLGKQVFFKQFKKGNIQYIEMHKDNVLNVEKYKNLKNWFKVNKIKLPKNKSNENLIRHKHKILFGIQPLKEYIVIGHSLFEDNNGDEHVRNINLKIMLPEKFDKETANSLISDKIERQVIQQSMFLKSMKTHLLNISGEISLLDVKNKATRLHTKLINGIDKIHIRDNFCVVDSVYYQVIGKKGFHNYTLKKFTTELSNYVDGPIDEGVSINELINWAQNEHTNITICCIDPLHNVFQFHKATQKNNIIQLYFLVNNGHVYPILDKNQIDDIRYKKRFDIDDLLQKFEFIIEHCGESFNFIDDDNRQDFIEGKLKGDVFIVKDVKKIDLIDLAGDCIIETNYVDCFFKPKNRYGISAFKYPTNEQIVIDGTDFDDRKYVCDLLYNDNKYHIEDFKFKNQSYTQIANSIMSKIFTINFLKSTFNKQTRDILNDFQCTALIQSIDERCNDFRFWKIVKSLDIFKSYSYMLIINKFDFPIFDINCDVKPFTEDIKITCGLYYINRTIIKPWNIVLKPAFYSWNLIIYLLNKRMIKISDIKYYVKASYNLKSDIFKKLVIFCYEKFPSQAKNLINSLIGSFNVKFHKYDKYCLTDNLEVLSALIYDHENQNKLFDITTLKSIFLFRSISNIRTQDDDSGIYSHVISGGIINLLELCSRLSNKDQLISVNTDCIYYIGKEFYDDKNINKDNVLTNIGKIRRQDVKNIKMYYELEDEEILDLNKYPIKYGSGNLFFGQAGCGKTHNLIEKIKENKDNVIVLCPTNKACENINNRYGSDIASTFDSFLNENLNNEQKINKFNKDTVLLIDEFSMISKKWMYIIYQAYIKHNFKIYMYGDPNQIPGIEGNTLPYNWANSVVVLEMCGKINQLPYIEKTGRYTLELNNILQEFLNTGKLSHGFKKIDQDIKINITVTNRTRIKINKHFCKEGITINFIYQGKKEVYKINKDTPIICTKNLPKHNMYNSQCFKIDYIDENKVIINNIDFSINEFAKAFLPNYGTTIYRLQGETLRDNYNIYESHLMNRNMLYTALSRATSKNIIHINNIPDKFYKKAEYKTKCLPAKIFKNEMQNGKIYMIHNIVTNEFYIGETNNDIYQRLNEHINDEHSPFYKVNINNLKIETISICPCKNKKELQKYEKYFIQEYQNKGYNLLNKKQMLKIKEKPKVNIIKVSNISHVMEKRFKIIDDKKNSRLRLQYRDGNKVISISKKYKNNEVDPLDYNISMEYMENKRNELLEQYK